MKQSKTLLLATLSILGALLFTGCGESNSKKKPVVTHNDPSACQNLQINTGIPGNTACPYQGQFDPQLGYQGYALIQGSAKLDINVGIGFKIDYGWEYNDLCPTNGQVPVINNGQLLRCQQVNPIFSESNYENYTLPNTGECTGTQYNPEITGCSPFNTY